jgi:hypothetical protein
LNGVGVGVGVHRVGESVRVGESDGGVWGEREEREKK